MDVKELFDWYYCPGEAMLSIGFYRNPYRQWSSARFRHIFAFDEACNLYVGQYSVYKQHMHKVCDLKTQHENGLIYPAGCNIPPKYIDKINDNELCVGELSVNVINPEIHKQLPIVDFEFIETSQIEHLNYRLKLIAQRLYDYGMPEDTILYSNEIDLWNIRLYQVLKGDIIRDRPSLEDLQAIL